jgi:hypothetical protein
MLPPRPLPMLAFGVMAIVLFDCVDATHDDQVQALGGEDPAVQRGPLHRPGQPCLVCHGGEGPASGTFSVAGTVYALAGQSAPAVGAQVLIEDVTGVAFVAPTNPAGNFYITANQWKPTFPLKVQITLGASTEPMNTFVGRDGSCATCHTGTHAGPTSAGAVYAASTESQIGQDGGLTE